MSGVLISVLVKKTDKVDNLCWLDVRLCEKLEQSIDQIFLVVDLLPKIGNLALR